MRRPITPIALPLDAAPTVSGGMPEVVVVDPRQLQVDESYQRDLTPASFRLIARIATGWDWRKFKPPIVIPAGRCDTNGWDLFDVVDGQHTAIGAASNGLVPAIPVMVLPSMDASDKAKSFLGHNRDRVAMMATQLFHAAVAAGDEDALTVQKICDRAGVRILRLPPPNGQYQVGDTMAVSTLRSLAGQRGAMKARIVVEACVKGMAAPVSADLIKAADAILHDPAYAGEVTADNVALGVRSLGDPAWGMERRVAELQSAKRLPRWRALTIVLYQRCRKTRGKATR